MDVKLDQFLAMEKKKKNFFLSLLYLVEFDQFKAIALCFTVTGQIGPCCKYSMVHSYETGQNVSPFIAMEQFIATVPFD
jgi:hypothetical protein